MNRLPGLIQSISLDVCDMCFCPLCASFLKQIFTSTYKGPRTKNQLHMIPYIKVLEGHCSQNLQ